MFLYITQDRIGTPTGGGSVTHHESRALVEFAAEQGHQRVLTVSQSDELPASDDPFEMDLRWLGRVKALLNGAVPTLAHVYAGCFGETCAWLKRWGCKVTYTVAAHRVRYSIAAHYAAGVPFNYPHLMDPALFDRYGSGYLKHADVVVVPSPHSASAVAEQGRPDCQLIPHGYHPPAARVKPTPDRPQTVFGYLGAYGPDKGVCDLMEAWSRRQAAYRNDVLILAGLYSQQPYVTGLVKHYGLHNVSQLGWVNDLTEFYDGVDVYVQPSRTEGFGMEVIEAMAHGTPTLCSTGAGASYLVPEAWRFPAADPASMAAAMNRASQMRRDCPPIYWESVVNHLAWPSVRAMYRELWSEVLGK